MINDYYDDMYEGYYTEDDYVGYQRLADPTCACNCHGYSTERGYLVHQSDSGMGRVLADDYEKITEAFSGEGIRADLSHSVAVTYYGCNAPKQELIGFPRLRAEKNVASGIYYWDCYPDALPDPGEPGMPADLYRKKGQ